MSISKKELKEFQWLADKYQKYVTDMLDGESHCCGASACSDMEICSECGEHCTIITEEDEIENQKPDK